MTSQIFPCRGRAFGLFALGIMTLAHYSVGHSETLRDITESKSFSKIAGHKREPGVTGPLDADSDSNLAALWRGSLPPTTLLKWVGINIPGFRVKGSDGKRLDDHIAASASLMNSKFITVELDIKIPDPSLSILADTNTLRSFQSFTPPWLPVEAEQVVEINSHSAHYYRTRSGACSLLFNLERKGILNLRTNSCLNEALLMEVANYLNFERLDQKLKS